MIALEVDLSNGSNIIIVVYLCDELGEKLAKAYH